MRRRAPSDRIARDIQAALDLLERDGAAEVTVEPLADLPYAGVEPLRDRLRKMPVELRLATIQQMANTAGDNVRLNFDRALAVGVEDEHPEVRRAAVEALWECSSVALLNQLLRRLDNEDDRRVRMALVESLGRFSLLASEGAIDHDLAEKLQESLTAVALNDPFEGARLAALVAVAYFRPLELEPAILAAYDDGHDMSRELAITAMGRFGGRRWASRVIDAMITGDTDLRILAARAAPYVEESRLIPYLYEAAEDEQDTDLQLAALWALGEIGGPNVQSFLESYRDSASGELVYAAEVALENAALLEGLVDTVPLH